MDGRLSLFKLGDLIFELKHQEEWVIIYQTVVALSILLLFLQVLKGSPLSKFRIFF